MMQEDIENEIRFIDFGVTSMTALTLLEVEQFFELLVQSNTN